MSRLPQADPFELAKEIITAFPGEGDWEERKHASLPDMIQALRAYLAGRESWESVKSQLKDSLHQTIGILRDGEEMHNIFSARGDPKREEVEKVLQAAQGVLAERRDNPHLRPDIPDPTYLKEGIITTRIDSRLKMLATIIAEAAMYNVMAKRSGRDAPAPLIEIRHPKVFFRTLKPFGDVRRQAILELENVKEDIANMFFTQGQSDAKEYWMPRQLPHPCYSALATGFNRLFNGNPSEDFVNMVGDQVVPKAIEVYLDPEATAELRPLEEADAIAYYYVVRQPERRAWLERYMGVGRQRD